jgi:hypothetical protein
MGDTAYCYCSDRQGELSEGKIVAVLNLERYNFPHYVIEIETHIDPILVVRDALTMADTKKGPIGFYELMRDRKKKTL